GDGRPGLMSTLLTKNQGNYTRRLRSLSTKRIINGKDSYTNANYVSIARQFLSHARDPIGSAFLSFSTSLAVAGNFVHNYPGSNRRTGIIVARIDARRLVGNFMSQYISEREVLVPLVVFPDEIVAFVETTQASKMNMKPVELTQQILKQFQIPTYSPEEVSNIWKEHGWMYIKNNFISEAAATCGRVFSK
ncbi:MAG: hypothetical protein N2578_08095, partial [Bdellovibrionaceae bacterium]|nr:hypothetical protein [Pseudobdellovibrionaceae bacterium]